LIESRVGKFNELPVITSLAYETLQPGIGDLTDATTAANTCEARHQHFDHDAAGLVRQAVDPLGFTTTYTYYERGLLATVTDPNLNRTTIGDPALDFADAGSTVVSPSARPGGTTRRRTDDRECWPRDGVRALDREILSRPQTLTEWYRCMLGSKLAIENGSQPW
jgi:YD repeat-containing protein